MSKTGDGSQWRKGVRDGFDRAGNVVCEGCFQKKQLIDDLRERVTRLERTKGRREELKKLRAENAKLRRELSNYKSRQQTIPIGAHTPSSQRVFQKGSAKDNTQKRGGAVVGHVGTGRRSVTESTADSTIHVAAPQQCPDCSTMLRYHSNRERTVLDVAEIKVRKISYQIERKKCVRCNVIHETRLPLFPRGLYSNALLSQIAVMHYDHGIPIGRICELLGKEVNASGVLAALQRLGRSFEPAMKGLIESYRASPVKHADETSWRTDGRPGWAWLFCTPTVSILECQDNRSSQTPQRIFGTEKLLGTLVVDRFAGYNKAPCEIQYCYAHLLREVKKLEEEFPDEENVRLFTDQLSELLSRAMRLQNQPISDRKYYAQAKQIAKNIKMLAFSNSSHLGIKNIQHIFCKNEARLYHWVSNRIVPAHNNRAERELRRTVIARKVSFGSQSENGAKTRSILMSVLLTAKKRLSISLEQWFTDALNKICFDPSVELFSLFPTAPP